MHYLSHNDVHLAPVRSVYVHSERLLVSDVRLGLAWLG